MGKFLGKYNDFIPPSEERKKIANSLRSVVNGSILTRKSFLQEWRFIIGLVVLGIVYIGSGYYYTRMYHRMVALEKEVKELRIESLTTASTFMSMSKQSEVIKQVKKENLNLEEAVKPPYKIYIKKHAE